MFDYDTTTALITWFKNLIQALVDYFHEIQKWFETGTWPGRVILSFLKSALASGSDASGSDA
jgi:hypothetical protein